ncbi:arylamine N-acetyltransferase family protein [Nocardia iowensis]|uniref:Arylamine N-acetyltransferase n=1 Tax=Nocardia iowensis TaxID=204891 RepID=A0ABX8RY07_NOCIO|nr:arylamine N-acetyltransferase [Nocardia iowensis]QXN94086.1 arylamine N-acetyltransferase [Nocardia iowensis]
MPAPTDDARVGAYLRRIGFGAAPPRSATGLAELHAAHAARIPFETLWHTPSIAVDDAVTRIVDHGLGGICYHLNGAFGWLLDHLGYRARLHPAATQSRFAATAQPPTGTHVVLTVDQLPTPDNPEGRWLLDVGAGEGFDRPLPLVAGEYLRGDFRYRLRRSDLDPRWWRFDYDRRESCRGVDFAEAELALDDVADTYTRMAETDMAIFFRYGWVKCHDESGFDELIGCQLSRVTAAGRIIRTIEDQDDYFTTLATVFHLAVTDSPDERAQLWQRVVSEWSAQRFRDDWAPARARDDIAAPR